MNSKAQVSFDYLITVTFAILFTVAIVVALVVVSDIVDLTVQKVLEIRNATISSLLGN